VEIIVEGWRAGREERDAAKSVPTGELPTLTDEQKMVAKKMGISEEAYARSTYAGRRNQERLTEKTKRFARVLEKRLTPLAEGARIDRIRLVTIEHEYRIDISANGKIIHFRLPEEMVDDLIEGGSASIEEQIANRLENVLAGQAA
jgi:hypothetical protein